MESNFMESDILGSLSSNALILQLAFAPEVVYLHTFWSVGADLGEAATATSQPHASSRPRGTAWPCASLLVREDPPRGHAHLRRPLGPASSAPPRGGASAGRQPRAAAAPCTSSVSLRPRATPARLQWPGNSISNLSSLCSAGMLLCFMPLLVACGVMH